MTVKRFLFQRILKEGIEEGFKPGKTEQSREWFREQAGKLKDIRPERLVRRPAAKRNQVAKLWRPGEMYLFRYEPKGRETLKYYDRYPLIMLVDTYEDGFIGLNFHYLPPEFRALLLNRMYRYLNNTEFNEQTRLLLTYDKIKRLAGRPYYKPCVKRYINNRVIGRFIKIHPSEWDMVLMLPLDRFMKRRRNTVWQDSRKIYQGPRAGQRDGI